MTETDWMLAAALRNSSAGRLDKLSRAADGERPIDLVHLARQTDGDEQLETELLAMFDRQSEKLVERVRLAELPRRARGDIAHRLRGSALAIGAGAVARAAEALEAAFEAEGPEPEPEIEALAQAVAAARGAIADLTG
jgi:HPt (histidine-containing phosphotransfer) domain-containing protein